ncbi:uncharacterized protein IWZ02DRAFT_156979 [Phyllosticta citriasiana]|uniref:PD-(D/E)XK nuclease-like domain-containing protein n=1 Tax=Phyllosticta citriasiana TaxID=595635 RepID=A0ABR1KAC4_9PEZI
MSSDSWITTWLEDVETATNRRSQKRNRPPSPSLPSPLLSPSSSSPPPPPPATKRHRSRAADMPPSPRSSTSTPSKRSEPHATRGHFYEDDDDQVTPRPVAKRKRSGAGTGPSSPARSSTTTTTASSSYGHIRPMADLTISGVVTCISMEDVLAKGDAASFLGQSLGNLFGALPLETCWAIIPPRLKSEIEEQPQLKRLGLREENYRSEDDRSAMDILREYGVAMDVLAAARKYDADGGHESSWNSEVHTPLLRAALKGLDTVDLADMMKAKTHPQTLVSYLPAANMQIMASRKMVDYAIVLNVGPSWPLYDRLRSVLQQDDESKFINASDQPGLHLRPIAIGIETKRPKNCDRNEAEAQLTVWATLQLRRVRQVIGNDQQLPGFPVLLVLGHCWDIYFVIPSGNDAKDEVRLYGPSLIGHTRSFLGVYRLLGSLRALYKWVGTDFKAWWDDMIPA